MLPDDSPPLSHLNRTVFAPDESITSNHGRPPKIGIPSHAGKPTRQPVPMRRLAHLVLAGGTRQQHKACLLTTSYLSAQANLQPGQAVQVVNDRLKRIGKVNTEIADWLQV